MHRKLSSEQMERREAAVASIKSLPQIQKITLENIDGVPLSLVEGEQLILHTLLFSEKSVTVEEIRRTFQAAIDMQASAVLTSPDTGPENITSLNQSSGMITHFSVEELRKKKRELDKEFSEGVRKGTIHPAGKTVLKLEKGKFVEYTSFLEREKELSELAKQFAFMGGKPPKVPSYPKVQDDLFSLEFLGLANYREDGNAKIWRVNEDFYSLWIRRRTELLGKIRNKEVHPDDLPNHLHVFYHLGKKPAGNELLWTVFDYFMRFVKG